MDEDTNQKSGVSISTGQNANINGDVIGRDKIINNYYGQGQPASASAEFAAEQRKTYQALWAMLEEVHLKLRADTISEDEFSQHLTAINSFILKNSLHIEKSHGLLASDYIKSIFELSGLIASSNDKRAKRKWASTDALPDDTLAEYETLKMAWASVDTKRDELTKAIRAVLQS